MEMITSSSNQTVKQIKKLQTDKKERFEKKMFYVEGVNLVRQAIDNGWEVEKLFLVEELIDSEFKRETIAKVDGDKLIGISKGIFASLANKNDLQGISALIKMKQAKDIVGACTVLENVAMPGNLGSILRASAAFGVPNVITIQPCVDFYNPDSIRASMGAIFHLNLVSLPNVDETISKLTSYRNLATTINGEKLLNDYQEKFNSDSPIAIWFGSESKGLSRSVLDRIKEQVTIKMSGKTDSLNLAESVAITLYQLIKV